MKYMCFCFNYNVFLRPTPQVLLPLKTRQRCGYQVIICQPAGESFMKAGRRVWIMKKMGISTKSFPAATRLSDQVCAPDSITVLKKADARKWVFVDLE